MERGRPYGPELYYANQSVLNNAVAAGINRPGGAYEQPSHAAYGSKLASDLGIHDVGTIPGGGGAQKVEVGKGEISININAPRSAEVKTDFQSMVHSRSTGAFARVVKHRSMLEDADRVHHGHHTRE